MQTPLKKQQEIHPRGFHFHLPPLPFKHCSQGFQNYLGIFQRVSNTRLVLVKEYLMPSKHIPSKYLQILGNLWSISLMCIGSVNVD
jgi:hypothetical protein